MARLAPAHPKAATRYARLLNSELPRKIAHPAARCHYCGKTAAEANTNGCRLSLDHVIPMSRGGTEDETNLVAACSRCNTAKRNRTVEEARHNLMLIALGWPYFSVAQLEWLRQQGFDLAPYDNGKLFFEQPD